VASVPDHHRPDADRIRSTTVDRPPTLRPVIGRPPSVAPSPDPPEGSTADVATGSDGQTANHPGRSPRRPAGRSTPDDGTDRRIAPDVAVGAFAAAQHGIVTRGQLTSAGISPRTIRRRTDRGELIAVGARTYRLASAPGSVRSVVMAACLDRGAFASHRTALWLQGIGPEPERLDVTVRHGASRRSAGAAHPRLRVRSSTNLPDDDVVTVDGIPTTSLARSLFGTAAQVPHEVSFGDLVDVVAQALESGKATMPWLRWLLEERRCRGRNGVLAFEAALDARDRVGPTESWLERHFVDLVTDAGLPRPAVQRRLTRSSGTPARVDFLYEAHRLVVEVLGYAFHRTPEQLAADTMRANELQAEGHRVFQITARHLSDEPARVVALLAAMVAPAGHA